MNGAFGGNVGSGSPVAYMMRNEEREQKSEESWWSSSRLKSRSAKKGNQTQPF